MANLADVVARGDRRRTLEALRDRLAAEADDVTWEKHKRECRCVCGMGDGRTLVAIVKELRAVEAELDKLPGSGEVSELDRLADGVVADLDKHRRAHRRAGAANP